MKKLRERKISMVFHVCKVEKSWADSSIEFRQRDFSRGDRVAVIKIDGPSDIQYIRNQLNEIELHWKSLLEAIR